MGARNIRIIENWIRETGKHGKPRAANLRLGQDAFSVPTVAG